jgi:GPH family glycoside/pentoside/hexuronide:cation symporter
LQENRSLTRGALAAYGLPAGPVMALYMIFLIVYLKFATDHLGASPAAVGIIFFVAKCWDALTDPLVGNLSDRTRSRLGRRRSWLLASTLPLLIFGVMAWVPPTSLEGAALSAWIAVSVIGFYTAFTIFDVPHMALGAELSFEPKVRARVFASRHGLRGIGMVAAGLFGPMLMLHDGNGAVADFLSGMGLEAHRDVARVVTVAISLAAVVTILFSVAALPDERADFMGRGGESPFRALRDVFRNPHARILLFVYFVEATGMGAVGVLIPYSLDYVLEMPHLTGPLLGTTLLLGLASIPFWVLLAHRFEKRRLWLGAMGVQALGFGTMLFARQGDWIWMAIGAVCIGTTNACGNVLGQALKADVVDYDEHVTGERKEGAYFAAWGFVGKLGAGVMIGTVGIVLEAVGYVPGAVQTESVKNWIVFLMGGMPLIGFAIGIPAFMRLGLTEAEHRRIRRELDARA